MLLYENVIFDLYGTLVDIRTNEDKPSLWRKLALFYGYYGAHYNPEELHQAYLAAVSGLESDLYRDMLRADADSINASPADSAVFASCDVHEAHPEIQIEKVFNALYSGKGVAADESLVIHTGQFFRVLSTERLALYPHAAELLDSLKAAGAKVYLLSNAQRIFTEYEMHLLGITDYFDDILISSDYNVKKPDYKFFRLLIDRHGIDPSCSIMVGNDGTSDIAGARSIGLNTLYIRSNISPDEELPEADYVLKRMNLLKAQKILLPA